MYVKSHLRLKFPTAEDKWAYLVLLKPESSSDLLLELGPEYFPHNITWLVADGFDRLQEAYFPLDSQVYTFKMEGEDVMIREMYKIDKGLQMRSNDVGTWNNQKLTWDKSSLFKRRKDLFAYQFQAETLA